MMALIEKGEANPAISILWKIAGGDEVSFLSLLGQTPEQATAPRRKRFSQS